MAFCQSHEEGQTSTTFHIDISMLSNLVLGGAGAYLIFVEFFGVSFLSDVSPRLWRRIAGMSLITAAPALAIWQTWSARERHLLEEENLNQQVNDIRRQFWDKRDQADDSQRLAAKLQTKLTAAEQKLEQATLAKDTLQVQLNLVQPEAYRSVNLLPLEQDLQEKQQAFADAQAQMTIAEAQLGAAETRLEEGEANFQEHFGALWEETFPRPQLTASITGYFFAAPGENEAQPITMLVGAAPYGHGAGDFELLDEGDDIANGTEETTD